MALTRSADSGKPLRSDFDTPELNIPLKDAPIVSLRALENGDDGSEGVELRTDNFWKLLLMSVRRRRNGASASRDHEPLKLPDDEKTLALWKSWRVRRNGMRMCVSLPMILLCFFGIVHIINIFLAYVRPLWDDSLTSFPTNTRDIIPIPCHSHNDYWRQVPLFDALRWGCTGVEADVWLFDNELFVGHNTNALTRNRTFRSMYVEPLVKILDEQNRNNEFTTPANIKNGVFDVDPHQTLVLLVDFKNSGPDIYPVVSEQLATLREKGYLTYFDGKTRSTGPITVVATGNAPFDLITANTTYRDIFFDAPLDRMYEEPTRAHYPKPTDQGPGPAPPPSKRDSGQGTVGTSPSSHFDTTNSYYASVSFKKSIGYIWGGKLSHKQINLIRGQIQGAKRRGLKARYWGTPNWPVGLRNHVWDVLVKEGVDYLNGDDLRGMARLDWSIRRHWGWLG